MFFFVLLDLQTCVMSVLIPTQSKTQVQFSEGLTEPEPDLQLVLSGLLESGSALPEAYLPNYSVRSNDLPRPTLPNSTSLSPDVLNLL